MKVNLNIEGKLEDGKMLVTCGDDICTQDVPSLKQTTIQQPYPVYSTKLIDKKSSVGIWSLWIAIIALILAIIGIIRSRNCY